MPSSTRLKKLYYAKSVGELNQKAESTNLPAVNDIRKCCKSAYKLFEAAGTSEEIGDEELAYVRYVKFISFYTSIRKAKMFEANKKFCSDILGDTPIVAMQRAEDLQKNLIRRYQLQEDANKLTVHDTNDSEKVDKEVSVEKENKEVTVEKDKKGDHLSLKSNLIIDDTKKGKEDEESITSFKLYEMINTSDILLIILDARPAKDFEGSHMKYDFCVNVPEEILNPGMTAAALEKKLPAESMSCWKKRSVVDFVILLDWKSTLSDLSIKHPLHALSDAISKWDLTNCLKSTPLVLEGGYDDWLLQFPALTTNPNISRTSSHTNMPSLSDIKLDIDYPDLDKAFIESPENPPCTINYTNDKTSLLHLTGDKVPKFPNINRDLKPLKDGNFVNGSLFENVAASLKQNSESATDNELNPKPLIDRKLKPKPVSTGSKIKDPTEFENKDSISHFLQKEESVLEENIKVGTERLRKEMEFEILRNKKLYETEEIMKLEIQRQEEELLAKVQALEQQAEMKETEYQKLKAENDQIKQELNRIKEKGEENDRLKKLQEKEAQKKQLMEEVERLRELRKMNEKKETERRKLNEKSDQSPAKSIERQTTKSEKRITNHSDIHVEDIEYRVPLKDQSAPGTPASHGGLSRSHSSPNIAQLVENEASQAFVPKFDRTLKPPKVSGSFSPTVKSFKLEELNAARKRNLQPIYGNQGHAVTGLRNLGNTCFMNAVIQCLGLSIPLSMYFVTGLYHNDIVRDNKQSSKGEVAEEFAAVIWGLWTGVYKSITPRDFKNTVSKYLSVCVGYEQQDSHEFLIVLLEKLHSDLNKGKTNQQSQTLDLDNLSAEAAQEQFWNNHKRMNKSIISDLFEGLMQSTLKCLNCNKISNSYEVLSLLSLPITSSRRCSLTECLDLFLEAEKMTGDGAWHCPRCKQKQEARKKMFICRLPEILIIHLKRFSFEGMWRRKLETYVDFPFELQMKPYVSQLPPKNQSLLYKLYGVVNHHGTMEGGHYIAYCKNSAYDRWYKYDDHEVFPMAESEVKTSAAYILFYSCTDFRQYLQH